MDVFQSQLEKLKPIGRKLRRFAPGLTVFIKGLSLLYSKRSYLKETGYIRSVRTGVPCKQDGSPIPWMNYNVISFLEKRLSRDLTLFEYGSGNSTLFFAAHVGRVVSVEVTRQWYEYLKTITPDNVTLMLHEPFDSETYLKTAEQQNRKYDIVVIDAEERTRCLRSAPRYLSEKGVIILDDTQGQDYYDNLDAAIPHDFRRLDFIGLKPGSPRGHQTTILYRDHNCLGI